MHSLRSPAWRDSTATETRVMPWCAVLWHSTTAVSEISAGTGAHVPTATCRRKASSCLRPASRRGFSCCSGVGDSIRTPMTRCSGRSTPMISGPAERTRPTSATFVRTGLVRIAFTLPPSIRLIDPASLTPSLETIVDVWRAVPTVNDVALTGPDGTNPPWARGPNTTGGYQLDGARRLPCRSRHSGPSSTMRRSRTRCRKGYSTTSPPSSACCSRAIAFGPFQML